MPTSSEQSRAKFPDDKGGLKADWEFFWGVVLFSFLFVVGCALQKAEPVRMLVADQAKKPVIGKELPVRGPAGNSDGL